MREVLVQLRFAALLIGGLVFSCLYHTSRVGAAETPVPVVDSFDRLWNPGAGQLELKRPVAMEGQVLYYDPLWKLLWLFDGSAGGYIGLSDRALGIEPGDHILIKSRTVAGDVAIDMDEAIVTVQQPGLLPEPVVANVENLRMAEFNDRFVRITGFVVALEEVDEQHLVIDLAVGSELVQVTVLVQRDEKIPLLHETLFQVDGVLAVPAVSEGSPKRPALFANNLDDTSVLEPSLDFRFSHNPVTVASLEGLQDGQPIVLEGLSEVYERGDRMTLRDKTGVISFPVWQNRAIIAGSAVQVSARVKKVDGSLQLEDAVFRELLGLDDESVSNPWNLSFQRVDSIRRRLGSDPELNDLFRLRGIVTGVEQEGPGKKYYLQDRTGAVELVAVGDHIPMKLSSWVDVVVAFGGPKNARRIEVQRVLRQSPGRYPEPERVALSADAYRRFNDRFSELIGLVTDLSPVGADGLRLEVQNSRGSLDVICWGVRGDQGQDWLESMVNVCGVSRQREDEGTGNTVGEILVSDPELIKIQRPSAASPFEGESVSISELRQTVEQRLGRRTIIHGIVTHKRRAGEIYLADRTGGIVIRLRDAENLEIGESLEVSGYPVWEGEQIAMELAVVRAVSQGVENPSPLPIARFDELQPSLIGLPVVVSGEVVDVEAAGDVSVLRLFSGDAVVPIELPPLDADLERESIVSVKAVYLATYDEFGTPTRPRLVVNDIEDLRVLESAPLFSPGQLLAATGVGTFVLLLFWLWNSSLRRRVAEQTKEIREQHRKERVMKQRFKTLVESADDLIFTCDRTGKIQTFSAAGRALLGYTEEAAIGQKMDEWFQKPHPEVKQLLNDHSGQLASGGSFQIEFQRSDGSHFWGDLRLKEISDWRGASGVLGVVRDISRSKAIEEELATAKNAAESADRAKSEFLANMSHEIRTPMNGVIGMAELLMESSLNSDQKGFVETIRASGETLIRVINDILDFSKFDAGRVNLELQPFDPQQMFEHIVDSLDREAAAKGLYLDLYLPANLPRVVVGDEVRVRQVLWNLIGNAVKFTKAGGVQISVKVQESGPSEPVGFDVEIRDTGIGMSPEQLSRIFQPFSQGDTSTTRRFGGTGLGLAISMQLVKAMGGDIAVQSEVGSGSSFVVSVSLSVAEPAPDEKLFFNRDRNLALLVEGEGTTHSSLGSYLEDFGFNVRRVAGGAELDQEIEQLGGGLEQVLCFWPEEKAAADRARLESLNQKPKASVLVQTIVLQRRTGILDDHSLDLELSWLRFPVRLAELREILVPRTPVLTQGVLDGIEESGYNLEPLDILVAEDSVLNRRVIAAQLKRLGHRPVVVEDGQALLDILDQTPYDVILMDCQMPRLDGFQATRKIRETPNHLEAPIVALTAAAREEDRQECLAAGMNAFVSKPVVIEQLQEVLREVTATPAK